ncbi:hypothetical protein QP556_11585 [Citrobacter freundii]|uniref:gp53-like domain-containing protein n=1 Tax=Citrobacter freundii TaxID=546 RepID=UPI00254F0F7C|nr:hypothetical protein [Citrobacter freundii]MDK7601681.1 hypothetical protein [Citrobacter freundii]
MYHVDNSTGVPVMPQPSPVSSKTELFFTEGGNGVPPTYPGPDWFNAIQSELLNILRAAGLDPDKMDNTQILAALKKLFLSRSNPFGDIKADGAAAIATALSNLGLSKVMIGDWGYKMGFIADIKSQPYINHQASGDNIVLATLEFVTNALHGKQPLDETLTAMAGLQGTANKIPYFSGADTLDLTDLSAFARTLLDDIDASTMRATLGLKAAALREIGTGTNQIPDMSVQGFGSNWVKTVGGLIIQKGSVLIPQGQNYATVAFPIPFLSGGVVNLTWSDTPSNTGTSSNITYGVVAGSNLPTGFQAWMAGAGGYNLSYIAIGY